MVGSKSMSLHGWKVFAEWSLEYSCMTPSHKSEVKKQWLTLWNAYCQWIVDEYGSKYPATTR
jgi:adenosine deaminase CECR1